MNIFYITLLCACIVTIIYQAMKMRSIKKVGSIVINHNDPEKDIYTLELDVPFGELDTKSKVLFTIRHE